MTQKKERYQGLSAVVQMAAFVPDVRSTSTSPALAFGIGVLRSGAASIRQPLVARLIFQQFINCFTNSVNRLTDRLTDRFDLYILKFKGFIK